MTPADAKRLVLVGTIGAGSLAAVASFRRGDTPSPRLAIGVFAAGTLLAASAEFAPGLAGGFSVLMLTSSALVLGGDAWAGIAQATSAAPKKVSPPAPKTERTVPGATPTNPNPAQSGPIATRPSWTTLPR